MRFWFLIVGLMNILRLVHADKDRKKETASPGYQKIAAEASCKDKGQCTAKYPENDLKERLTPVQYFVTQNKGTERPFSGQFLRQKGDGVYTCVVCDNQLFRSDQKYESTCGWPSFRDVIAQGKVTYKRDSSHGMSRMEVVCAHCGAHLGHVFEDGPPPHGLRYCINSASMNFKHAGKENDSPSKTENGATSDETKDEKSPGIKSEL